jgi:DNA-binding NtrC family response regulator
MEQPKILIVDDESQVRDIIKEYLKNSIECDISESESGEDAIEKMKANDFDLVILDLKMPGISGLDVIKTISKEKPLPDIIVATAWDSAQIADEVIKEGAIDYISKPVELSTIKLKIKPILAKKGKYFEKS